MAIKLNTGREAFPIEFDNGDKDCIYFNPNDPDLAKRLLEAKDKISARIEKINIEKLDLANNGEAINIKDLEAFASLSENEAKSLIEKAEHTAKVIEETKHILFEELNTAFNSDVSSVVFKHCSPFAVVSGEYFVTQFLTAITPEIQKRVKKSTADVQKKLSKHTAKYMK